MKSVQWEITPRLVLKIKLTGSQDVLTGSQEMLTGSQDKMDWFTRYMSGSQDKIDWFIFQNCTKLITVIVDNM